MKALILAAGAFEMRVPLFLAAMFLGRLVRFGVLSFLVIRFGPGIIQVVERTFHDHKHLFFVALISVVVLIALWFAFKDKFLRRRTRA